MVAGLAAAIDRRAFLRRSSLTAGGIAATALSASMVSAAIVATPMSGGIVLVKSESVRKIRDLPIVPNTALGLAFPGGKPKEDWRAADAGMGRVLLDVDWNRREPAQGRYQWPTFDRRLKNMVRLGIEPVLSFRANSKWGTLEKGKAGNGKPQNMRIWRDFVRRTVTRYKRGVKLWGLCNEWTASVWYGGGWGHSPRDLVDFVSQTYDEIKTHDPEAKVFLHSPPSSTLDILAVWAGKADYIVHQDAKCAVALTSEFIRTDQRVQKAITRKIDPVYNGVFKNGKSDLFDYHLYGPISHDLPRIAAVSERYASGLRKIATEIGGPSMCYQSWRERDHFFEVIHRNLLLLSQGFLSTFWLFLFESKFATEGNAKVPLLTRFRHKEKPGYIAMHLLAAMLKNTIGIDKLADDVYRIRRKTAPPLIVAWGNKSIDPTALGASFPQPVLKVTDPVKGEYVLGMLKQGPLNPKGNLVVLGTL